MPISIFIPVILILTVEFVESSSIINLMEDFVSGTCKYGSDDFFVWDLSYSKCIVECLARSGFCVSISYRRSNRLCRIHSSTASYIDDMYCTQYIHTERSTWQTTELSNCGPNTCTALQRCDMKAQSESARCSYHDCPRLLEVDHGQIYGNVAYVHGKLVIRCNQPSTGPPFTVTCLNDGTWDTPVSCIPPVTPAPAGITTATIDTAGAATTDPASNAVTIANYHCYEITCGSSTLTDVIECTLAGLVSAVVRNELGPHDCNYGSSFQVDTSMGVLTTSNGCRAKFDVCIRT